MNERIREIAQQAGHYVNSVYIPPVRSKTLGKIWEGVHIPWQDLFNAKFAELIVQECMAKCAAIEKNFEDAEAPGIGLEFGAERSVANSCKASIADHFGVNLD